MSSSCPADAGWPAAGFLGLIQAGGGILGFIENSKKFIKKKIGKIQIQSFMELVTECFFNLFLEGSHVSNKLEQLEFKLEKNIGI